MLTAILVLISIQTFLMLVLVGNISNLTKAVDKLRIFGQVPQEPPYGRN